MEKLDRILAALPKHKLSRQADFKIKIQLYRLIFLGKLEKTPVFAHKGLAFAMLLIMMFGTTAIYAYASGNVLPGTQLYPIKLAIETIEQKISVNLPTKISTYEKFSARRLQEAVTLSQKNLATSTDQTAINQNIQKNINSEISNHQAVVNSINNINDSAKATEAISQAKKNDQAELNSLNKIADYAKTTNNQEVLQTVNEAKNRISRQEYKINQGTSENNQNPVTVSPVKINQENKNRDNNNNDHQIPVTVSPVKINQENNNNTRDQKPAPDSGTNLINHQLNQEIPQPVITNSNPDRTTNSDSSGNNKVNSENSNKSGEHKSDTNKQSD